MGIAGDDVIVVDITGRFVGYDVGNSEGLITIVMDGPLDIIVDLGDIEGVVVTSTL